MEIITIAKLVIVLVSMDSFGFRFKYFSHTIGIFNTNRHKFQKFKNPKLITTI